MKPNIFNITGSDPSSKAGIQADLKAISANDAFAMAGVTALTLRNTQGVCGIHLIPPGFVRDQIRTVFDDIHVDAIKFAMIANTSFCWTGSQTPTTDQ